MKLFLDCRFKESLKICSKFSFAAPLEAKARLSEGENHFSIGTPSQVALCEVFSCCHRISGFQLDKSSSLGSQELKPWAHVQILIWFVLKVPSASQSYNRLASGLSKIRKGLVILGTSLLSWGYIHSGCGVEFLH